MTLRAMRNAIVAMVLLAMCGATSSSAAADVFGDAGATASVACSNETIKFGYPPTRQTLKFALLGNVSCDKGHSLMRAYFRAAQRGDCEGSHCLVDFPGGWTCSYLPATTSAELGGAVASCFQLKTGAKVRVYRTIVRSFDLGTVRSGRSG